MVSFKVSQDTSYPAPPKPERDSSFPENSEPIATYPPGPKAPSSLKAEVVSHSTPEEKGPFPPLDSSHFPSQIFWLILSFSLLYTLLSRFFLPKTARVLENRKRIIAEDLAQAEVLKKKSELLSKRYAEILSDAHTKAEKIRTEALVSCRNRIAEKKAQCHALWADRFEAEREKCQIWKKDVLRDLDSGARDLSHDIIKTLGY